MNPFAGLEKIIRKDEPLNMHTWFHLGGPAEVFAEPNTAEELLDLITRCHENEIPIRLLGEGSNILVRDEPVPGLTVRLSADAFRKIQVHGNRVTVAGGAALSRTVTTTVHGGLAGLELLIGIPGTVGGALHGNAGAGGGDIGSWVTSATVITDTAETITRSGEELVFGYRASSLDELVILEATLQLEEDDPETLARSMQKQWIIRKARQPMGHQCAGCIFRNPHGASAGELIESAGLKGTRIGGAIVNERHAGFIVAEPECTSADILRLIELVRAQVLERMGVELELEIEIW